MNSNNKHMPRSGNILKHFLIYALLIIALFILAVTNVTHASEIKAADKIIYATTSRMINALKQESDFINHHPGRIQELANQIIMPHVDFQRMSRWVLGKHWRRATAEQKQQFLLQFRSLILRTYATALSEYTDETIDYIPLRAEPNANDVTVRTIIKRNAGPNITVAYRMHQAQTGWKIYDISIGGISLVQNYRRSFASEIRRYGIDSLINKLTIKNTRSVAKYSRLASNQ